MVRVYIYSERCRIIFEFKIQLKGHVYFYQDNIKESFFLLKTEKGHVVNYFLYFVVTSFGPLPFVKEEQKIYKEETFCFVDDEC